ncbi:hypothetical protein ACFQ22_08645 [Lentilactobacillus raoultii]|uniref:DUF218 domain-containing protein n=1 Tax=Lentilactobacillus raoultii TaxID=1987503 RepID=A0ABW3PSE1_9LACO|nr:hypothetical protein [Lentilactobacillus raoultii]
MDEIVFFNPGDSIGNFHDHNEAVKTAQIYKQQQHDKKVLVVHGANNQSFDIFLADDAITHNNETSHQNPKEKPYRVSDQL